MNEPRSRCGSGITNKKFMTIKKFGNAAGLADRPRQLVRGLPNSSLCRPFLKKISLLRISPLNRPSDAPPCRPPSPLRLHCVARHGRFTEPASLHDERSSKQASGGVSCDAAPPASCPRRCTASFTPSRTPCDSVELRNDNPSFIQTAR
jgi:hypothetical protein